MKLEVVPAYGDPNGSHVTIRVVSDAFEGKRSLQRQQMVYKVRVRACPTDAPLPPQPPADFISAHLSSRPGRCSPLTLAATAAAAAARGRQIIWEEMQSAIHAVDQMVVQTPKEAGL